MQSLSPLILFQSLLQPLISDSAGLLLSPSSQIFSSPLVLHLLPCSLHVFLPPPPYSILPFFSFLLSLSSSSPLPGIPWQSFWCNIRSTPKKMPEMKPPIKIYGLYEPFKADENVQIVVDAPHVTRLTAVWALKCDKTEAQLYFQECSCMCTNYNPCTVSVSLPSLLLDSKEPSVFYFHL